MQRAHTLVGLLLAATLTSTWADPKGNSPAPDRKQSSGSFYSVSGGIGVDPITAVPAAAAASGAASAPTASTGPNTVRGISPGGRAWTIGRLSGRVAADGSVRVAGRGLLLTSGEGIATVGTVASVMVTLACGSADDKARKFNSPPAALDAGGNFSISGVVSEDGINAAVLPPTCDNPVLLVRSYNATTKAAGGWLAAGIKGAGMDD